MVVTRTNGTPPIGPTSSIPAEAEPTGPNTKVVSAEQAIEWPIAGVVWQADITGASYTTDDHALRVEARLLRLTPGPKERWQFCCAFCASHLFLPVGAPGNAPLTRPMKQSAFTPFLSVIYEIKDSDWLPSCQPVGGAPDKLRHYVVVDDTENRALHVAATHVIGHQLEECDDQKAALQTRLAEALVSASERG